MLGNPTKEPTPNATCNNVVAALKLFLGDDNNEDN